MGATFILKRKSYTLNVGNNMTFGAMDGLQIKDAKGFMGHAKNIGLNMATSPIFLATGIAENAKGKVEDAIQEVKDTASTYNPTVQNAYAQPKTYSEPVQKSYGVIQAAKEIGTGVGKGIWNYAKQNKKTALGMAAFGAGMPAVGWATNRIQRQAAENQAGTRTTDGMSTGGKIAAGATTLGAASYAGYTGSKSWNNQMTAAQDIATGKVHYDKTGGKTINTKFGQIQEGKWVGGYDQKKHGEFVKGLKDKSAVIDQVTGKEVKGADGKVLTEAKTSVQKAKDKIAKLNNKSFMGLKGKSASIAKRAGAAGLIVGGAGLLANSMLRQPKKQENTYSDLEQRQYAGFFAMGKKMGKLAYDKAMKTAGSNAGLWDKTKAVAKGVGTGVSVGARKLGRSTSNFLSLGSNGARDLTNNMRKSLESIGSYGKKAADFIGRHKTGTMIAGAATVGTAGFNLSNAAGEKPVETLSKLDKKTTQFKNQQQMMAQNLQSTSSMNS